MHPLNTYNANAFISMKEWVEKIWKLVVVELPIKKVWIMFSILFNHGLPILAETVWLRQLIYFYTVEMRNNIKWKKET